MGNERKLQQMNLELTTACPLYCPQCYCSLEEQKHLDLNVAKQKIDEGVELGLQSVNLSGGETMCYPHLYELVSYASQKGLAVNVALSGVLFDQDAYDQLTKSGVSAIHISLNGSTDSINSLSRNGYEYAINALDLLCKNNYKNTIINWVMHSTNADDFMNLVQLAEQYKVSTIVIISLKPDSSYSLPSFPTYQQIYDLSKQIKSYEGPIAIRIESCFSNFLALHLDTRLFGNLNISSIKGCTAGRNGISISVEGRYSPCRHLEIYEEFESMKEYWLHSDTIQQLLRLEENQHYPCKECYYSKYCRHCQAITWKLHQSLYLGFESCPVFKSANVSTNISKD